MIGEPQRVAMPSGTHLLIYPCREDRKYPVPAADEILIVDDRAARDPSFQVRDSYRIGTRSQREEILVALIAYAAEHPGGERNGVWQRTVSSMEREWLLHNIAYRLGFMRGSAKHVDLNNAEESGSLLHYAVRLLGTAWRRILKK